MARLSLVKEQVIKQYTEDIMKEKSTLLKGLSETVSLLEFERARTDPDPEFLEWLTERIENYKGKIASMRLFVSFAPRFVELKMKTVQDSDTPMVQYREDGRICIWAKDPIPSPLSRGQ